MVDSMMASFRSRSLLAAALVALAACGEETALPTTLETAAVTEDVELTQAAFENTQTDALADLGYAMDNALLDFGGLPTSMASIVAAGPNRASDPRSARRLLARAEELSGAEPVSAIPVALLGRTLVWNSTTQQYVLSDIIGAPENAVRFRLYQIDPLTELPASPLVFVGYADLSRSGTVNNPIARLAVYSTNGTELLEYVATVGGTQQAPSFRVDGTAGVGPNAATFSLTVGVNLNNGTVTAVWRTAVPSRGLTSRTTLGIGQNGFTLNGVMQRGLSKVEVVGTLTFNAGGEVTVKVGNRTFATMTISAAGVPSGFTDADGAPLTPEQAQVLALIFAWFDSTWKWYAALLDPVYTVLDVPLGT
jgi:hypothetical protein